MTTAAIVRTVFIDALTPQHFTAKRSGADRFFADLVAALVDERYSERVLALAARSIIRTRTTTRFPSVATCIAACRIAQTEMRASSAPTSQPTLGGDGVDSEAALSRSEATSC